VLNSIDRGGGSFFNIGLATGKGEPAVGAHRAVFSIDCRQLV
jgi:hypothetical protein